MNEGRNRNWGRWALVNAAVSGWLIYDLSSAAEAPSQAVLILQYFLLALSLIGLAGSVMMCLKDPSHR